MSLQHILFRVGFGSTACKFVPIGRPVGIQKMDVCDFDKMLGFNDVDLDQRNGTLSSASTDPPSSQPSVNLEEPNLKFE